jgi:hypothetical protein
MLICALLAAGCGTSSAAELDTSEPWDLVWFSDSGGWSTADRWAERIEQTMGVEVEVHDYAIGGLSASTLLGFLTADQSSYRNLVANAEVIVIYGNPEGSGSTSDIGTCVSTSTARRDPPVRYSAADFEPYEEVLRSIYDAVFELRAEKPTIVRAIDLYSPVIADWREAGIEDGCTAAWEAWSDAMRTVAVEYGVAFASMYDDFNGPDHDEDPRQKGYIASDLQHTTPEGQAAQLEVLHRLGYEPIMP